MSLAWDDFCFTATNLVAGRWWLVDSLLAIPLRNDFVKSALVGASFLAAWQAPGSLLDRQRRREILLLTALAALVAAGTSKYISTHSALPRPYLAVQPTYGWTGAEFVPRPTREFRVPLDNSSHERQAALAQGLIPDNDFGTFPSDHAALFVTLALGILLAWRPAGVVACLWTAAFILWPRVHSGLHSPADLVGGAMLGMILGGGLWACSRGWGHRPLTWLADQTAQYEAWATGLAFLFVFEACLKFEHLEMLAGGLARHLV